MYIVRFQHQPIQMKVICYTFIFGAKVASVKRTTRCKGQLGEESKENDKAK